MVSKNTDFLIPILMKKLYEDNGELHFRKAIHFIRLNSPKEVLNTDEDIKHWLNLNSIYFKLKYDRIIGITGARLCSKHCSESGSCRGGCDQLHLCRFFILTQEFKCQRECRFGHDLSTLHNSYILQKYKLHFLKEEELRRLFRKTENRNQQTLPIICRNFNIGKCEKKNCRFLHVCKQFILGKCRFGKRCSVSHLIDDKIRAILHSYAIDFKNVPDGLHELKLMYSADKGLLPNIGLFKGSSSYDVSADSNRGNYLEKTHNRLYSSHMNLSLPASHQKAKVKKNVNTNKTGGICMKFLFNNSCSSECKFHHKQFPYQWQYKISSENDWQDFVTSTNEKLEEKYCHLTDEIHIPGENGFMRYNFEKMDFSSLKTEGKLRRLSTAPSVLYPNNKWNTVWVWYWKNDNECWIKYDENNSEYPVSSEEIENKYLHDREQQFHFIHEGRTYFIDFKEMFQTNGEKRAVIRRPLFFKEKNIEENAIKPKSDGIKREVNKKPRNKYKGNVQENNSELRTHFQIIELENTNSDFEETATKFNETMKARGAKIMSIETIENGELREEYQRRKIKMATKLGSLSNVNEMDLFHGTYSANISIISKQGFDVRLSGEKCGTRFGNGCYFTKKADYAHKYVTPEINLYKMFLVKVLVGHSCKGKMTYVRPPLVDPNNEGGDLYNSCVDDVENPNVFVIFANDQMYPAYIITYEMTF